MGCSIVLLRSFPAVFFCFDLVSASVDGILFTKGTPFLNSGLYIPIVSKNKDGSSTKEIRLHRRGAVISACSEMTMK